MKKIRYVGKRLKGTLNPRRIWSPGETLELSDTIAVQLVKDPEFIEVIARRRKKRATVTPKKPGE
ncbi:MAG: hypothetical protein ACOC6N_04980 [archaeon]